MLRAFDVLTKAMHQNALHLTRRLVSWEIYSALGGRGAGNTLRSPIANSSKPTLRLALGTAVICQANAWAHDHEFASAAMLAIKVAWESKENLISIPVEKQMDFDVEIYGYTTNLSLGMTHSMGGLGRQGDESDHWDMPHAGSFKRAFRKTDGTS